MRKTNNVRYHSFPLSDAATLRQAEEILSLSLLFRRLPQQSANIQSFHSYFLVKNNVNIFTYVFQ